MSRASHMRIPKLITVALLAVAIVTPARVMAANPTAAQLASQVKELDAQVASAAREYEAAYWRLDETEVRLERLDKAIEQTEADLGWAEGNLASRVTAMYRRDREDVLSFILGSESFSEMATRAELWDRIAEEDARIIAETLRLREEYRIEVTAAEQERERAAAETDALRRKRDGLESQLSSTRAQYDKLQAQLEAAIAAEAARNRVTYTPPSSANGMTFPVAGPNYYGNTWGASRSGGRRSHKGSDIMAARGTPCVAILPGTVQAKSGGLGGRTIWLTADNGWKFYYAHLDTWTVSSGRVNQGQVIGTVGSTGNASYTSPHLHFEIHPGGGSAVNPYPYLRAMQGY